MKSNSKNILIAGGTGLIGTALTGKAKALGHKVWILTRNRELSDSDDQYIHWDPAEGIVEIESLDHCDAIVNLAGAGVMDHAWSPSYKKLIIDSRVDSNKTLATTLDHFGGNCDLISASATGYYGDSDGSKPFHENDDPANGGFLQEVAKKWESASSAAAGFAKRHVVFRFGIVLAEEGGALQEMKKGFKLGVGSYFAPGDQHYSWIHIHDLCNMIMKSIDSTDLSGIYNAVAPSPDTAKQFAGVMTEVMYGSRRLVPVPKFALKLALGQRSEMLTENCPVSADKIVSTGFQFNYPTLKVALEDLL